MLNAFLNDDPEDEDMFEDDFEFHPTPRFIAELWIFLLNKIDSELNLKMIFKEKLPSLHYYGFDEKGRHLDQVGYGLFD